MDLRADPLRARGLTKLYGDIRAVDDVDLTVSAGDVYGYLGPNGAGKTTSLRMALGLIRPTAGSVTLFGRDPQRVGARALDGVAGFVESPRFYPYLSGRANLALLASLDGDGASARIDDALHTVDLAGRAGDRVGGYSHGMRQRLGIAAALLRAPRLLLLDEPATGLDPAGMRDMRLLIRRLAGEGITVLLSSHQLAEVEELCDRVAIIRAGRIVFEGGLADLSRSAGTLYRLRTSDDERALAVCRERSLTGDRVDGEIRLSGPVEDIERLSLALAGAGVAIKALIPSHASLEDLFFAFTEGGATADAAAAVAAPGLAPVPAPSAASVPDPDPGPALDPPGEAAVDAAPSRAATARATPVDAPPGDDAPSGPDLGVPSRRHRPGTGAVLRWELRKLRSQKRTYLGLGAAVVFPLLLVVMTLVRNGHPTDTPFGAYLRQTGLAAPLLMLFFGSGFLFPLLAALVAGDIVATEDHNGTLKTLLTRSVDRGQVFAGKALAATAYTIAGLFLALLVAFVAATLAWGFHPITTFTGTIVSADRGLKLVVLAYAVYLMPMLTVAAIALLLSTLTRNSAASVVGALVFTLLEELTTIIPGLGGLKPYILPTLFEAWHGFLRVPTDWAPIAHCAWVCALYTIPCLFFAYLALLRRDVSGG